MAWFGMWIGNGEARVGPLEKGVTESDEGIRR